MSGPVIFVEPADDYCWDESASETASITVEVSK